MEGYKMNVVYKKDTLTLHSGLRKNKLQPCHENGRTLHVPLELESEHACNRQVFKFSKYFKDHDATVKNPLYVSTELASEHACNRQVFKFSKYLNKFFNQNKAQYRQNKAHQFCSHYQMFSVCSFTVIPVTNRLFVVIRNLDYLKYFFLGSPDFDVPFSRA